jgi:hypothetical protein
MIIWFSYNKILINQFFLNRGIVVINPSSSKKNVSCDNKIVSHSDSFSIFTPESINRKKIKNIEKQKKLLEKITRIYLQDKSNIDISTEVILFNNQRREEIFLPILFRKEEIGIYLHAWASPAINSIGLLGEVKRYVTAGCLFGSSLKAKEKNSEDLFPLIHIDIDFFSDKLIDNIFLDKDSSIYETVLFYELDKFAKLIQYLTPASDKKILFYHLPYYDYIIFAAVLLVRNRISRKVFHDFHQIILNTSNLYFEKITAIFQQYSIHLIIESPYQNIFGDLKQLRDYETDKLLEQLSIPLDISEDLSKKEQEDKEKELIQNCWNKLLQNSLNLEHKEIWGIFSKLYNDRPPNNFKELLERANAMMVARASWKQKDFTVCSLLPHSEKQIQIGYAKLLKIKDKKYLSEVINLTIFDPVVTFTEEKNIGLFLYNYKIKDIKTVIQFARRNLFLFPKKNTDKLDSRDLNVYSSKSY